MSSIGFAATPLGRVLVVVSEAHLVGLFFDGNARTPAVIGLAHSDSDTLMTVRTQLDEYFAATRTVFDIPVRLEGTSLQLEVWSALAGIPTGTTATYAEIARQIGRPGAARAVGAANGRNPISIVVPCHRLVGTGGGLTGYGGGLDRKRWLLAHERMVSERTAPAYGDPLRISVAPG
jgi:methylated-DNA-[protein]-cysteine S-methyltransferase